MYRRKQKSIFRNISKSKRAIYWANEVIDVPLEQDEVVEWWGLSKNLNRLKNRKKEVILSSYDIGYLDVGFGNRNGANYASYIKWRNIYALRRILRESGSSRGRSACGPNSAISAFFSRRFGFAAAFLLKGFEIVRFRA